MPSTPAAAQLPEGLVRLNDWGVIRARGAEAAHFLHGQLTQDIEHLQTARACLAGYCSAKGRLLASFVVWRHAEDEILLACSADLLGGVLERLSMFVLRAKCKLDDASADWPLWGLAGGVAAEALPALASVGDWACDSGVDHDAVRLPAAAIGLARVPRFLWAGSVPPALAALDIEAWRWLEVRSGVARVVAATSEQFVPQMVNLELVGGVSFQKGCYPGQEVVARSQYRGTLKRRAYVLESAAPLRPGLEIFDEADPGQPAGMVVLAGSLSGARHAALAELKIAALQAGRLRAGSPDGAPLSVAALPYALPVDAA